MTAPRVAFITVNYRNTSVTQAFLESLALLDGSGQCEVAIVDNEADARTRAELAALARRHDGRVHLFHLDENRFYWPGAAFALEQLYSRPELMPEWLIVCNNDIVVTDRRFVTRLLAYDPEKPSVIAPSIVSGVTGSDQNPLLRSELGAFERLKWKVYYTHYLVARLLLGVHRLWVFLKERRPRIRGDVPSHAEGAEERIYAPHGACVIFSRAYFRKGGYLDTNFALYGEEITVAEIAKRIGAPVVYCPALRVEHRENAATGRKLTRALYRLERQAYAYFQRRYLSPPLGEEGESGHATAR